MTLGNAVQKTKGSELVESVVDTINRADPAEKLAIINYVLQTKFVPKEVTWDRVGGKKRLEYAEGEEDIYCPKCEGINLELLDDGTICPRFRCKDCKLEFTIRLVAVWEEPE